VFTGLVEATGVLARRDRRGPGYRLEVSADLGAIVLGESIAVNGACLTVVEVLTQGFAADVSVETVQKTTLGDVPVGGLVNLERALRLGDRLGGHLVSGHVDGIAEVADVTRAGDACRVRVRVPDALCRFLAPKGSVTLDGVSLTVNAADHGHIELMLIPHTIAATNLQGLAPGRRLNVEVDLLARYVVHHLEHAEAPGADAADERLRGVLARAGFIRE
jgi:riboflavin synthase